MPDDVTKKTASPKTAPKTTPKPAPKTAPKTAPGHLYNAEAKALEGSLSMPMKRVIQRQIHVSLPAAGGYKKSPPPIPFHLESVVSYTSAYTQVSGIAGVKASHGYATLATSVVEGLNILEILTCDRVVAQVATEHPLVGHTPEIVFLGTRFENLRIAGHPIDVRLDIDMVGPRSPMDVHYFLGSSFLRRVLKQSKALHDHAKLPLAALNRYTGATQITPNSGGNERSLEFSLVDKITGKFPGKVFGHVIYVPNFGTIDLATVKMTCFDDNKTPPRTTVELNMLGVKLGCIGNGSVDVASAKTNGNNGG